MTIYLGHRAEDGREQLLLDHLTGVARYAQAFADSFGAGALAYQIGLAHDAGKYSDKFQRRIRGAAVQVDHSTAGAQLMIERRNAPAAYCIAGHHGGLPDGGGRSEHGAAHPVCPQRKAGGTLRRILAGGDARTGGVCSPNHLRQWGLYRLLLDSNALFLPGGRRLSGYRGLYAGKKAA